MSKTAFLFPGQGSQTVGMLSELQAQFSTVSDTFSEASSILGYDMWQLVSEDPHDQLNQTEYTQPAMLTADIAVWRTWLTQGGKRPDYVAGHSLGEYAALVAAEALSFAEAVKLVQRRAQLMQAAVSEGEGGMLVIVGLKPEQIATICQQVSDEQHVLQAANLNAPGQIVLAGHRQCFPEAIALAEAAGASLAKALAVSVPAHSPLMQAAAIDFAADLAAINWQPPSIPVIHNADVASHSDCVALAHILQQQLHQPVRWVETIEYLQQQAVTRFIECGPGRVLVGLMRRINRRAQALGINTPEQLQEGLQL